MSSFYLYKYAGFPLSRGAAELLRTKSLRNSLLNDLGSNSFIGNILEYGAKKHIPSIPTAYKLFRSAQDNTLKADTYIGATLRGNAQPGSLIYSMFTNTHGKEKLSPDGSTLKVVPRASAFKPIQYTAEVATIPLALVGLESLRDPDIVNPVEFGGTI